MLRRKIVVSVITLDSSHSAWTECLNHLERVGMSRWALLSNKEYNPDYYYLGVMNSETQIIGHLSMKIQALDIPGAPSLTESYVNTFAVEADYRRRGYGSALQMEALRLSGELKCYQMRSWSSLDHPENYALKLGLGFSIYPSIFETSTGEKVKGVYFAKTTGMAVKF